MYSLMYYSSWRLFLFLKSTQYKKLAPNALQFTYWNLLKHMKKRNKNHQNDICIGEKLKTKGLMFFVSFFHVICKISNFNMWTAKHLAQASCTELTLHGVHWVIFEQKILPQIEMLKFDFLYLIRMLKMILNWSNTTLFTPWLCIYSFVLLAWKLQSPVYIK